MEEEELSLMGTGRWRCSQKTSICSAKSPLRSDHLLGRHSSAACLCPGPDLVNLEKQVTTA